MSELISARMRLPGHFHLSAAASRQFPFAFIRVIRGRRFQENENGPGLSRDRGRRLFTITYTSRTNTSGCVLRVGLIDDHEDRAAAGKEAEQRLLAFGGGAEIDGILRGRDGLLVDFENHVTGAETSLRRGRARLDV